MEGSYIKINRSLLKWEWYGDINTARLFIHMLLKANWKNENYKGTTVPRGSFISSLPQLSQETKLSVRTVRTCLEHLKSTGEVTVKSNNKYSVFTVNNYCAYQSSDRQTGSRVTGNRQATDTLINKRSKEGEEVNNIINNNIQSTTCSCQEQFKFVLKDGSYYEVPAEDLAKYKNTFPLVDVESELRVMECWCEVNKPKRKTRRGAGRFIVNWLTRKQEEQSQRGAARRQASKSALEAWANEEE